MMCTSGEVSSRKIRYREGCLNMPNALYTSAREVGRREEISQDFIFKWHLEQINSKGRMKGESKAGRFTEVGHYRATGL